MAERTKQVNTRTTLTLLAGKKSTGAPVHEEVLADHLESNRFKIVATPGVVLGVAAGDVVEIFGEEGQFSLVSRGGNLAIQIYGDNALVDEYLDELGDLSHRVDGRATNLTILTVPVRFGFAKIESALNGVCSRHPGVEWYYGNVYDPKDGVTPLNWWGELREGGEGSTPKANDEPTDM